MAQVKRPLLRWHGGKWKLAPWIIKHFPTHKVYTEAYGGAGSVLLQKYQSYAEIYNDLDSEVVNLFRVMRSRATATKLKNLLELTPFSREEFEDAYVLTSDEVEKARRLVIRSFMGFGSNAHLMNRMGGFRANSNRSGTTPAHDWANFPATLLTILERLKGVVIENRPALEILRQHDGEQALHYVDPPYPKSTRTDNEHDYNHEMTDEQHRELGALLNDLKGSVVVSGYPCKLYDQELYPHWTRITHKAFADGALERTEVLWLNKKAWDGRDFFLNSQED